VRPSGFRLGRHAVSSMPRASRHEVLREHIPPRFRPGSRPVRTIPIDVTRMGRSERDARAGGPPSVPAAGRSSPRPVPGSRLRAAAAAARSQRERVALSLILSPPERTGAERP
jgi:hypothetical protein